MRPIVLLEAVQARDTAGPRGSARGSLAGVSIDLAAGVHAFLGTPEDGMLALVEVLTGARAPQRGRVTVAGKDPARTAAVRARMGVLPAEPRLPAARTVRDAVRLAMRARGESGDRFDAVIDPLGLSHLHGRDPRSLSFAEERAVELALALSTPAPTLVVLHDPLSDVAVGKPSVVSARLREIASAGACVIVTTSSPADARTLADRVLVLHRGLVARQVIGGDGLALPAPVELVAWVREGARVLAAALSQRAEVLAVSWEEAAARDTGWPGAAAVRVRGIAAEACALALAEAAGETGVEVEGIEQRAPEMGEVRGATEALWRMARARAVGPQMAPQANGMAAPMPNAPVPVAPSPMPIAPPPIAPPIASTSVPTAPNATESADMMPTHEGAMTEQAVATVEPERPRQPLLPEEGGER
ncbi:MAG: ATP-binding cassette domain-containing protein [Minicystis sp.]